MVPQNFEWGFLLSFRIFFFKSFWIKSLEVLSWNKVSSKKIWHFLRLWSARFSLFHSQFSVRWKRADHFVQQHRGLDIGVAEQQSGLVLERRTQSGRERSITTIISKSLLLPSLRPGVAIMKMNSALLAGVFVAVTS